MANFQKERFIYFTFQYQQPKIDEIRFLAKQSNASIIGISKHKLDSSVSNSGLDIEDYDLIRLSRSRREGGFECYIRSPYLTIISQVFLHNIESIFIVMFLPKSKSILVGVLYRPFDKPNFIQHVNNFLKEKKMLPNR